MSVHLREQWRDAARGKPNKGPLYHGTFGSVFWDAVMNRKGLQATHRDGWCYLTENRQMAIKYARAWTAGMYYHVHGSSAGPPQKEDDITGCLMEFFVPEELLVPDEYNPSGEQGQWKVKDRVPWKYMGDAERIEFPDLRDQTVYMRETSFWVGVTAWR